MLKSISRANFLKCCNVRHFGIYLLKFRDFFLQGGAVVYSDFENIDVQKMSSCLF